MTEVGATRRAVLGGAVVALGGGMLGPRAVAATSLADPKAYRSARDLAALLDGFTAARTMAVGQQLNVNGDDPFGPLTALDAEAPALSGRVRLLGWTTNEWQYAVKHDYNQEVLGDLIARARAGDVLVTSWYPRNPRTRAGAHEQPGPKVVARVLEEGTPERKRFLAEFDHEVAPYLLQLQKAGVATVFRPLIEANSYWFWWGCDNGHGGSAAWRSNIRKLYRLVQKRAWAHGIHNLLWCCSFVPRSDYNAADPVATRPAAYDIAGLSSYDFEACGDDTDELVLGSYAAMAAVSPRMALAEVGPANSNGSWDPAVITTGLKAAGDAPAYGMFWFDDGEPDPTDTEGSSVAGVKQISSLAGGRTWLATASEDGLIYVG
ncbi:glycosyl hydrolase [Nocardioides sp. CN2-186]|uniref:glycosyl hydrolase n=1 Tax=Nocardioides tweenelious TaxID=3156607 RepID=UPI0032B5343B